MCLYERLYIFRFVWESVCLFVRFPASCMFVCMSRLDILVKYKPIVGQAVVVVHRGLPTIDLERATKGLYIEEEISRVS